MATLSGEMAITQAAPAHILVVEDSPIMQDVLRQQLENLGFAVACVSTCSAGRQAALDGKYSCALVDIGLPDGSGLDLVDEFRALAPHMVALILTGKRDSESAIGAMRAGAFDFLTKPVDMTTLRASIVRAVSHHELLRERAELVQMLREERDQLKAKIEAATADIRDYAETCASSNALLHSLVRLTNLSSEFHTDEIWVRTVAEEICKHLPLKCIALCDIHRKEFLAAVRGDDGRIEAVMAREEGPGNSLDTVLAAADPSLLTQFWINRHTDLSESDYQSQVFPQSFWGRPVSTVGFYLGRGFIGNEGELEFLGTAAHVLAFEWHRSHMMVYAAQHASLGNIAMELSRGFLQSLTAMKMAADFVKETDISPDVYEGMEIIQRNADYLTEQTQLFNKLSRTRADSVETVRLDQYIAQTLGLLSGAIKARGVIIHTDFDTPGECVLLNGTALARTILDLVSSAVRTVNTGGTVHIHVEEPDPYWVSCRIAHNVGTVDLFGLPGATPSAVSYEQARDHPSFLLAQRSVNTCGGRLTLERDLGSQNAFRILLPKDALSTPAA